MNASLSDSFHLTYFHEGRAATLLVDKPSVVLGRGPTCDISLPLDVVGVSRRHARISREGDSWTISDLDSYNGTFVNKTRIQTETLNDHDEIGLGPLHLFFHLGKTAPPGLEEQVLFHDRPERGDVRSSIPMANISLVLEKSMRLPRRAHPDASNAGGLSTTLAGTPEQSRAVEPSGAAWILTVFSQVAHALLASENLDALLERLMTLVFYNLPAERGFLCLWDAATETLTPKVVRTRGRVQGRQEEIQMSRSIANEVIKSKRSILVRDTLADERFSSAQSIRSFNVHSAMCAPLYHEGGVNGLIYVDTCSVLQTFTEEHLEVFTSFAVLSAVGVEQTRLRETLVQEKNLRDRLSRYNSASVVEKILANSQNCMSEMIAEEKQVTVLFCDLSGFTAMSEEMTPTDVAHTLNELFEGLTEVIFQYEGSLDKYMGDGMMAVFGVSLAHADHAERAVHAALAMQQELASFNRCNPTRKPIAMRVGINSGLVVAGDIGSPKRKDYTVIGDTVNVASRLESTIAQPGQVVIGPATYASIGDKFICEPLPESHLKGKKRLVQPYLVTGERAAEKE